MRAANSNPMAANAYAAAAPTPSEAHGEPAASHPQPAQPATGNAAKPPPPPQPSGRNAMARKLHAQLAESKKTFDKLMAQFEATVDSAGKLG